MRRKPKTRRHTARTDHIFYTTYRGLTGETVAFPYIVNTGKQYNNPSHKWWEGLRDTMTTDATANQLDIRGHGRGTSRVKRVQRQRWAGLARVVEALPPEEGFFQKQYETRMVPRYEV